MNSASQVRNIFAILRVYNNMLDPQKLWGDFQEALIEDYIFRGVTEAEAIYLALEEINQNIFMLGGTDLNLMMQIPDKIQDQVNMISVNNYKRGIFEGAEQSE